MKKLLIIGLIILASLACTPGSSTTQEKPLPTWQKVASGSPPEDLYFVRFVKDGYWWTCFTLASGRSLSCK